MNNQTKTREELLLELSKLKIAYESVLLKIEEISRINPVQNLLQNDEEKYKVFIELAADSFFQGDKEGNFIEVNHAATNLTGYKREELLKMNMKDLFSKENLEAKPLRYDLLRKGDIATNVRSITRKNGARITVEMNSRMLPDGTFQSIFRDITERMKAQEALKESEFRLARAEKVAKIGNWKIILDTKILIGSEGAGIIYGLEDSQIKLEEVQKIPLPEYREKLDIALYNLICADVPYDLEFKIRRPNDGKIVDIHSIAQYDKENRIVYGVIQDITERKMIEEALIVSKEQAEESDRLKSAFLANMSHEIRTPMNGILGFAELLKDGGLTGEEQQEYIQIIEKSGKRMLSIINDIVDISKIESGLMKLKIRESNINEQIHFLYTFFKPECDAKCLKLSYVTPLSGLDAVIKTDREKLFAILTNLIKNAIKYTNQGCIEFGYTLKNEFLEFYVKDSGLGISADRQEAIFERFIQADIADKMAQQGAGLGLSISKAYVHMLKGNIWLDSIPGIGSTFYFTIPFKYETENHESTESSIDQIISETKIKKLRILIAEDDEISKVLISISLKPFAKEIIKVKTGQEAIDCCRSNPDIDLILMDIKMPGISGYEAVRQIRSFNTRAFIIAQTAYGLSGDKEKALDAGCDEYISKPIVKDDLIRLIIKHFSQANPH